MPSPSKRIQVLLRSNVLETVEQISEEKGLSLSKVVSLLLEEALAHRGRYGADSERNSPQAEAFESFLSSQPVGVPVTYKNKHGREITATRIDTPELNQDQADEELLRKIKVLQKAGLL